MSENAARILPFVGTIALHLILGYFLLDTGLKKSDTSPEISIKVTFINSASVEKSSSMKAKPKREKPLEKAADITKPKITDSLSQKLEKGDKNSAVIEPHYHAETLNNTPPAYPSSARRLGQEGTVILRVLVLASGDAGSVDIFHSSGSSQLDEAALSAVRKWRFIPAKNGRNVVDCIINVPITFKLSQSQ